MWGKANPLLKVGLVVDAMVVSKARERLVIVFTMASESDAMNATSKNTPPYPPGLGLAWDDTP